VELEPERPKLEPERRPRLDRPESSLPPEPELKPEPALRAGPEPSHRPSAPGKTWIRGTMVTLLLLAAGAVQLWTGRDIKHESSVPAPGTPEIVADEIVVDLNDNVTDSEIAALNAQFGIQLRYNSIHAVRHKLMVAKVPSERNSAIVAALRQSKLVEAADPNYVRHEFDLLHLNPPTWKPNDPNYSSQWHLKMIGLEQAWSYTKGAGAVVAVLDTGVGGNDPKVWRKLKDFDKTKFASGYDFVYKDDIPEDAKGHGTHVAGTIAESTDNGILGAGVAPEATIMPVRVLGPRGGTDADISDGLHFAADNGANVVNMSLGGPGAGTVFQAACQYALSKGVTLVCAAGNDGQHAVSYPAKWPECIAVAAVDSNQKRSYYSNYGPEIDIAGPGGDIRGGFAGGIWQNTAQPQQTSMFGQPQMVEGFYALQGTSMATPHITGVIALLVSLGVKQPDEIRSVLRRSATNLGSEEEYGAGLVDAAAAMKATGRSPYERYYSWVALAGAAILVLIFTGRQHFLTTLIFLIAGYYLPLLIERRAGFGSPWNLVGHSVVVPVIWLLTPRLTNSSLVSAASLTAGLATHFIVDLWMGVTPLPVRSPTRISFWFFLNLSIAAWLVISAAIRMMPRAPRKRKVARKAAWA
jgi:serine protease